MNNVAKWWLEGQIDLKPHVFMLLFVFLEMVSYKAKYYLTRNNCTLFGSTSHKKISSNTRCIVHTSFIF